MREKQIGILSTKKVPKAVEKVKFLEDTNGLLRENEKLTNYLIDGRKKLTKQQFLTLMKQNNVEAVRLQTAEVQYRYEKMQEKVEFLQYDNDKHVHTIRMLE